MKLNDIWIVYRFDSLWDALRFSQNRPEIIAVGISKETPNDH